MTNTTTTVIITDTIDGKAGVMDVHDVAKTLRDWNAGAPADVLEACDDLEAALLRGGEPTSSLENFLSVVVS